MRVFLERLEAEFSPAAIGTAETKDLFRLEKGDMVVGGYAVKEALAGASTTSTISVGRTSAVTRWIGATDAETGSVGDIIAITSNLNDVQTAQTHVVADYSPGATPGSAKPRWRIVMYVLRK